MGDFSLFIMLEWQCAEKERYVLVISHDRLAVDESGVDWRYVSLLPGANRRCLCQTGGSEAALGPLQRRK